MIGQKKKILILGAHPVHLPAINYSLKRGHEVITVDNRPENPGHQLAHRNYNASTIEVDQILSIAKRENVDGILNFTSDVSALTCAKVAKEMGLPGNPPEAVGLLVDKGEFRKLLGNSSLGNLDFRVFGIDQADEIEKYLSEMGRSMVVKPVDSSSSRGVSVVEKGVEIKSRIANAFLHSRKGEIIVEEFVPKCGDQICGDGFCFNGKLEIIGFGDGHFYCNGESLAPYGETFPSQQSEKILEKIKGLLVEVLKQVGFVRGGFNFDVWIRENGEPFLNEIGPRHGGNFIPVALSHLFGVDFVGASVESSLHWDYSIPIERGVRESYVACYMIHSLSKERFNGVSFSPEIRENIIEYTPYLDLGKEIYPFTSGNFAVGNLVLKFSSMKEMRDRMREMSRHCLLG